MSLDLDAPTQQALRTLSTVLTYNEFYYLDNLDLSSTTAEQLIEDPAFRKALDALVATWRDSRSTSRWHWSPWSIVGGTAWADSLTAATYAPVQMSALYQQARQAIANAHGRAATRTPGVTSALANVMAYNVALGGPAPLPAGGPPLGSNYTCVVVCSGPGGSSAPCGGPDCSYTPPCSVAELDFPSGNWRCLSEIPDAGETPDTGSDPMNNPGSGLCAMSASTVPCSCDLGGPVTWYTVMDGSRGRWCCSTYGSSGTCAETSHEYECVYLARSVNGQCCQTNQFVTNPATLPPGCSAAIDRTFHSPAVCCPGSPPP